MNSKVASLRNEYLKSTLDEKDVAKHPIDQFKKWFEEAIKSETVEPSAFVLGTVDQQKQSDQRTILLKGYDEAGFVFYTNYKSKKGIQIEENPQVSLLFPWFEMQRQIIICGMARKVSKEESEKYFHSRPKSSQIGAIISNQSETLSGREELESKLKEAEAEFENRVIPLPDDWGGYLVRPTTFEFWQGRANRLHDRIFFELVNDSWKISRLSP